MPTASELIEMLPIVSENIVAEAAVQAQKFIQAATYRVERMRVRARATATLEQHRAHVGLRARAKKDSDGKKPTEGAINARIELDSVTKLLRKRHDEAHAREELAKLILEAHRIRRDSVRILSDHLLKDSTREGYEVDRIAEKQKIRNQVRQLENRRRRVEQDEE